MRVLHLSTWQERCGIAEHTKQLVAALTNQGIANDVFPVRRQAMSLMSDQEVRAVFDEFLTQASRVDLVHIQHEFSFFAGSHGYAYSVKQFDRVLTQLRRRRIPFIVTFHTEPIVDVPDGTRRTEMKRASRWLLWRWHVSRHFRWGLGAKRRQAVIHTRRSRLALMRSGFSAAQVQVVPMGYPQRQVRSLEDRAAAKERLGFPRHATLLSIFGFIANHKGHAWAVDTLKQLPATYCLAVVGGRHPASQGDATVNAILESWKDQDPGRLRVTGFVPAKTVDLYHAATDICLVPYLPCNLSASGAMSWALTSGRPTIASNIAAFQQLNEEADCLQLVQPGAVYELAWQIQQLARDEAKQRRMVRKALAYAAANNWDAVAAQYAAIYDRLVPAKIRHAPLTESAASPAQS
jgi:glycosyltransferase involved in cell wall biosynthesis